MEWYFPPEIPMGEYQKMCPIKKKITMNFSDYWGKI